MENNAAAVPAPTLRPAPRVRATDGEKLLKAVYALTGAEAQLVSHSEVPWASITFAGSRHTIVLRFIGWEACDEAEHLIAALPDHEFTVPGVLVADATVSRTDQELLPEPRMEVEMEILLLHDK